MGLVRRIVRCALRHWEISRFDIKLHLEVVGEHILPVGERVIHFLLAVVEDEQLIASGIRGRLLVNRVRNNREFERGELSEIGEIPGSIGHDRSFLAVPSTRVVAHTRGRIRGISVLDQALQESHCFCPGGAIKERVATGRHECAAVGPQPRREEPGIPTIATVVHQEPFHARFLRNQLARLGELIPGPGLCRVLRWNGDFSLLECIEIDLHGCVVRHPGQSPHLPLERRERDERREDILLDGGVRVEPAIHISQQACLYVCPGLLAVKPSHVRGGVAPCFDLGAYHLWILHAELIGDQVHAGVLFLERWEQSLLPKRFCRCRDCVIQVDNRLARTTLSRPHSLHRLQGAPLRSTRSIRELSLASKILDG